MRMLAILFVLTITACCSVDQVDPGPINVAEMESTTVLVGSGNGRGTGVVISTTPVSSFVLTAGHIYSSTNKFYWVETFAGEQIADCYFIHVSKDFDLGLLYVPKPLKSIKIAATMPKRGSTIYTDGNKLGGGFWPTHGIYGGLLPDGKFARSSIPTHPGNSGGPIVYDCKLIGIVSRILVHRGQLLPTTLLFVPLPAIKVFLEEAKDKMQVDETPTRLEKPFKKVYPVWPAKTKK